MIAPELYLAEEWKKIRSEPGYEASSHGRIRSTPQASKCGDFYILTQNYTRGYPYCSLGPVRRRVNRLVCEAFHGPAPNEDDEAAHLDNDKTNNAPSNLAWKSSLANKADQPNKQKGTNNPRAILTEADVAQIRGLRKLGYSYGYINKIYSSVSKSTIAYVCKGKSWSHVQ